MLNWIWLGLILGSVGMAAANGLLGEVSNAAFEASKKAVMELALPLAGLMALWLGMMRLAEKAGLVQVIARGLRPLLRWLFPDVPANHPAMGSMVMNMAANMLGLNNAATPLGLRAMQDLEKLNPRPGVATNAMCTFLAVNTSSIQLIPATAVAYLAAAGATQPTAIIGTAFVATLCSTIAGISAVKFLERLPGYQLPYLPPPASAETETAQEELHSLPPISPLAWLALALFFVGFGWAAVHTLQVALAARGATLAAPGDWIVPMVESISVLAIPFILTFFPLYAALRRIPVYEEFVEGAKEGIQVAIRIIPFLVAILVAIGMFRAAGGITLVAQWLGPTLQSIGFPVELLPLVLIRPLSGGGANGIFAELAQTYGGDSLIARMGGTIMGSTETTFYVIAVYFGSVAIRRTRHAVPAGLIADLTGVIAAVVICRMVWG